VIVEIEDVEVDDDEEEQPLRSPPQPIAATRPFMEKKETVDNQNSLNVTALVEVQSCNKFC
jgi:hypothetical protein